MERRKGYNPKRRIAPAEQWPEERRKTMAARARYGGNPEHKSRPGDYQLTPAVNPRPGKTLCDARGEFPKVRAEELLQGGFLRALVSDQERGGWPQNVWSVLGDEPYESQLENKDQGIYHGYPMPKDDDFRILVLAEWIRRER
jgi:hypothetical protein